jgi:hypothetical protein
MSERQAVSNGEGPRLSQAQPANLNRLAEMFDRGSQPKDAKAASRSGVQLVSYEEELGQDKWSGAKHTAANNSGGKAWKSVSRSSSGNEPFANPSPDEATWHAVNR